MRIFSHLFTLLFCFSLIGMYGQTFTPIPGDVSETLRSDQSTGADLEVTFREQAYLQWEEEHVPALYAAPVALDYVINLDQAVRAYTLSVPGAESFFILFEKTDLSGDFRLRGFDPATGTTHHWTAKDFIDGQLLTPEINGRILELQIMGNDRGLQGLFLLKTVYVSKGTEGRSRGFFGFGASKPCEVDVRCDTGDDLRNQERSVVRMRMALEEGIGWCSASIVNNTSRDGTPYILSAYHCLGDYTPRFPLWRFDFNYTLDSCGYPASEPAYQSMQGCVLRARERDADFMLLELLQGIPAFYNPYYSGWDRRDEYTPERTILIHHPAGDVKKISLDKQAARIHPNPINWLEGYTTPPDFHYRVRFDEGIYEPGSSGAPLYDLAGRIVGQLHGGLADCLSNFAYCGRLARSWEEYDDPEKKLSVWLDPEETGITVLEGMEHPGLDQTYTLAGQIKTPAGKPMKSLEVKLTGDHAFVVQTDAQGGYHVVNLPKTGTYGIAPYKNDLPKNGVSAVDLLLIQKHLLGTQPFDDPLKEIAADANGNGITSAADIFLLQKLLLNKVPGLITNTSWVFTPRIDSLIPPEGDAMEVDFTAIKVGDVNDSVNPDQ